MENVTRAAEFQGLIKANSNGGSQECLEKAFLFVKARVVSTVVSVFHALVQ